MRHAYEMRAYEIILVNIISRGLCISKAYVLGFQIFNLGFLGKSP
jgi:hypothetical protein